MKTVTPYAFPSEKFSSGMTLRDYLAARMMVHFLEVHAGERGRYTSAARNAYDAADAMLAERDAVYE